MANAQNSTSEFVLYTYFRSSASYRVRCAFYLKGLSYEARPVHLVNNGGEQYAASYAALNPSREVPTLVHKGHVIGQSIAILDYLDQVAPTPRIFPVDPAKRALVFQACEIINSGAQPLGNLRVQKQLVERFGATDTQKEEWTKYWIQYGLETLEAFLKPHAGRFSIGDEVTAADCCLMPHMYNADRFKVPTEPYPTLRRIYATCSEMEAFKKASPSQQSDAPKP